MTVKITTQYACEMAEIPDADQFQRWACVIAEFLVKQQNSVAGECVLRLVDTDESAELNQSWRNKAGATNVLSFPADKMTQEKFEMLGDIVICAPIVRDEALQYNKTSTERWALLFTHGFLHLVGYDHQLESDAIIMESAEQVILLSLGFDDPYELT